MTDAQAVGSAISVIVVIVAAIVNALKPKQSDLPYTGTKIKPVTTHKFVDDTAKDELRKFCLGIHGIYHGNCQQVIRRCKVGDRLLLVREPENKHDQFAVKVCLENGEQLGYIGADRARQMSEDILSGWTYRVTVDKIYLEDGKANCRIRLGVLTQSNYTEEHRKHRAEKAAGKAPDS